MNPARTSASSSATSTRCRGRGRLDLSVIFAPAEPAAGPTRRSRRRAGPAVSVPPSSSARSRMRGCRVASAGRRSARVLAAVVGHRDGELVCAVPDLDLGRAPAACLVTLVNASCAIRYADSSTAVPYAARPPAAG